MTLSDEDRAMVAEAAETAREAGLSEEEIERIIRKQLGDDPNYFDALGAWGHLRFYAKQRQPRRPPGESPTRPPPRSPDEW
jgi:hypothetical protein